MKISLSFLLVITVIVILAVQQSQGKKGCKSYGHACWGGHGKRSLSSLGNDAGGNSLSGSEQSDVRPVALLQVFPKDTFSDLAGEIDAYPRYRLIQIIKSMSGSHSRRLPQRIDHSDIDYFVSAENFNGDNINKYK